MPTGVASYVDAELGSVGASINEAVSGYGWAADDAAARADSIATEQSMVGSMTSAFGTDTGMSAASGGAVPTAGWLSGMSNDAAETGSVPTTSDWSAGMSAPQAGDSPSGSTSGWIGGMTGVGPVGTYGTPDTGAWVNAMPGPVLSGPMPVVDTSGPEWQIHPRTAGATASSNGYFTNGLMSGLLAGMQGNPHAPVSIGSRGGAAPGILNIYDGSAGGVYDSGLTLGFGI